MNSTGKIVQLVNPTNNQDAATKSYVDTSIPVGGIIMWSGTTGTNLPSNWKLCDGSTHNGITTPDLRGRFVLSSGSGAGLTARTVSSTGGAETVALTEAQMPKHTHGVSAKTGDVNGNATDGDHGHPVIASRPNAPQEGADRYYTLSGTLNNHLALQYNYSSQIIYTATANSSAYSGSNLTGTRHNHTITVSETAKGGTPTTDVSAHENMPPFYVLAFIMRIS